MVPAIIDNRRPNRPAFHFDDAAMLVQSDYFIKGGHIDQIGICAELFKLTIGGYGLFGVISTIKLRLVPRTRLKRAVKVIDIDELIPAFEQRIKQAYMYGDFQYMTDSASPDFLRKGVFSCYLPVNGNEQEPTRQHRELQIDDWKKLYRLAFTDKGEAFRAYSQYYLGTIDQLYWSDTHQLSVYLEGYHITLNSVVAPII